MTGFSEAKQQRKPLVICSKDRDKGQVFARRNRRVDAGNSAKGWLGDITFSRPGTNLLLPLDLTVQ